MMALLGLIALGWFVAISLLTIYTAYTLTHPPRRTYASALARNIPGDPSEMSDHPRSFTSWNFASRGMNLPVWDVKGDDSAGPIVIMTHGWGDSRIGGLSRLESFAACASRVLMWDMPGHGDAPGTSSLGTGEVDDLVTLIKIVQEREEIAVSQKNTSGTELQPLVLFGWSMGGGVSIAAAGRCMQRLETCDVRGVIVEGIYRLVQTPARNVLKASRLPYTINLPLAMTWLGLWFGVGAAWNGTGKNGKGKNRESGTVAGFDRAKHAACLKAPVLAIHGAKDEISPLADAQAIINACKDGRLMCIEQGGHSGLWTQPESRAHLDVAVKGFLREICPGTTS